MRLINLRSEKSRIYSERKKKSCTINYVFLLLSNRISYMKIIVINQQTWEATLKEGHWISMKKYPKKEELNKITELALHNLFYILPAAVSIGCDTLRMKTTILLQFYPQQHCWCELLNLGGFNSKAGYVSGQNQWFLQTVCTSLIQDMISNHHPFKDPEAREWNPGFTASIVSFANTSNGFRISRQDLICTEFLLLSLSQSEKVN